jgi:uncharacterized protein (TIGR02099 family)
MARTRMRTDAAWRQAHPLQSLALHIPFIMPSTARAPSRPGRIARFAAKAAFVALGACFALLLALRVVVYPQLEAHRADIARWLGARIGQPVEIDAIVTGWNGWNPELSIRGFRVSGAHDHAPLLDLPRVDLVVAWTSIPRLDLRLKTLAIEAPRLAVRRDTSGRLHVAGFEWPAGDAAADDSAFADWLLRQPQVVVRDALLSWTDEWRKAPQLILDHVNFRLVRHGDRHQAGLTGVPPAELAAPIDVRADVVGTSLKDLASLRGRLYARLDYADVGAWREWLPLPFVLESGRGAVRMWADFAAGQANDVTADLELADVRATLGDDLAPLSIAHLGGRARWTQDASRRTFTASSLSIALPDGTGVAPTNLALTLDSGDAQASGGSFAFDALDLAPLATIAAHVPLPDALRGEIGRLAPRGMLSRGRIGWSGDARHPTHYTVAADVRDLSLAAHADRPSVHGVSGSVALTEHGGEVHVDAEHARFTLPHLFADTIAADRLHGTVAWEYIETGASVQWRDVAFANADVTGTTSGSFESSTGGPGTIELAVALTHANLATAHRYVPRVAHDSVRQWLREAIRGGTSSDVRLVLAGDLAQFPFSDGKGGRFALAVKAVDATLAYAEPWPPFTGVAADVRIEGPRLVVDATRARMGDIAIGATHAEIADFRQPLLTVDGRASGPTGAFLAFMTRTPVAQWIGHATDGIKATGDGRLALTLALPLEHLEQAKVNGRYVLAHNDVDLAGMPTLANAEGELAFTERDFRASDITAQALGGTLKLAVSADGERVHVDGTGTADVARVREAFDVPILARMQGATDWKLALDARAGATRWTIESSLAGASIDLPAPLRKAAAETTRLRVERKAKPGGDDRVDVDYGRTVRAVLHRRPGDGSVDRALVQVGKAIAVDADATQPGLWIRADVPAVDVDDWLDVALPAPGAPSDGATGALAINGIDLQSASMAALGRTFANVKASVRRRGDDWRLTFDGPQLAGNATWHTASADSPDGRIVARLSRFAMAPDDAGPHDGAEPASARPAPRWPAVDLVADTLVRRGRSIGRLEVQAQPAGPDWQIRKLVLANDAGRIDAHGSWQRAASPSRTQLDVAIDVKDAPAFLERFGWPDAIKGTPTKIDGNVSWSGAPTDFDVASLGGRLTLASGAGQFTKVEPGVGRLLGVLSLQALPRRISLDFRDVFSEGFAFDSIAGDVRMERGVLQSDGLRLAGPAAAVEIAGDVDLAHATQRLRVRVQPALSTGVSAGAAALFIANPLVGAAVGAGALLAQKILNNPFDRLFSYRYTVSGSFDDPVVTRDGDTAANASAAASR